MSSRTRIAALAVLALAAPGSACGGGARQDADEPSASFRLDVVDVSFPRRQSVAARTELAITVRNADRRAVPNVAVTVETRAGARDSRNGLAARVRTEAL